VSKERRSPRAVWLLLAAALCLVAACAQAPSATGGGPGPVTASIEALDPLPITADPRPTLPVTVTSFDGQQVTINDASRIVAADQYGTLAETVFALGLGDNLVVRDSSTTFPGAADIPNVTPGGHALNAEAILNLNPTVVLTDTSIGPRAVQTQLRDAGVPVVLFDPTRTIGTVGDQIQAVAEALGLPAEGERLAEWVDGEITAATSDLPLPSPPLRVAFLYFRGTAISILGGPGSGADSLVTALGAQDAGTASGLSNPFTPVTSEALIAAAPDVLLVMTKGLDSVGGVDGLLAIPGIAQTPAGEQRRIVDMDDTALLSFGPRTGQVLGALAAAFYPDAPQR
jgi:iron complex transport system substrate-binding protein